VDFNVPLDKKTFVVTDDTRIRGHFQLSINTERWRIRCSDVASGKTGRTDGKYSLKPVLPVLENILA